MMNCKKDTIQNTPLLQVDRLSVSFPSLKGKLSAVNNISFKLHPKETLGFVGPSGSGKTTAALAILRLLRGAEISGSVIYNHQDLFSLNEKKFHSLLGKEIAFISQHPMSALNPTMSIGKQVGEALLYHKLIKPREAPKKILELLEMVGIKDAPLRIDQYPHQLSGGLKQRVLIAMALSCYPKILIADEPTTALEPPLQLQILELLQQLQHRFSMGLIIISHSLPMISDMSDRILIMDQGQIIQETKRENLSQYYPTKTDSSGCFGVHPPKTASFYISPPLLDVQHLFAYYPAGLSPFCAVHNVSFSLRSKETLSIIGESGAGKSTLAKALLGLIPHVSGKIYFEGKPITFSGRLSMRRHIQIVFQDPVLSLNPKMSVKYLLKEPFLIHGISHSDATLDRLLDMVHLSRSLFTRLPHQLSGGQRQRVNIARALALSPKLIVFDEPFSSLDPFLEEQLITLLLEIQKELSIAYLFISHNLPVATRLATRLAIMHKGTLIETSQIQDSHIHKALNLRE